MAISLKGKKKLPGSIFKQSTDQPVSSHLFEEKLLEEYPRILENMGKHCKVRHLKKQRMSPNAKREAGLAHGKQLATSSSMAILATNTKLINSNLTTIPIKQLPKYNQNYRETLVNQINKNQKQQIKTMVNNQNLIGKQVERLST